MKTSHKALASLLVAALTAVTMWKYLQVPVHREWTPLLQSLRALQAPGDTLAFRPGWVAGAAGDLGRTGNLRVVAPPESTNELAESGQLWLLDWGIGVPPVASGPGVQEIGLGPGGRLWRISRTGGPQSDLMSLHLGEASLRGIDENGTTSWERGPRRLRAPGANRRQAVLVGRPSSRGRKHTAIQLRPGAGETRELSVPVLARSEELVLLAGVADKRSGSVNSGPPIQVELWLDGERTGRLEVHQDRGWQQVVIPVQETSGTASAAIRVSGEGAAGAALWVQVQSRPVAVLDR